jgi:dTDP-4-amino-4,6-dideoxygalactose transaminase
VWADIDPWTGNLSLDDIARRITPRTKAIIAIDWAGYPCDLAPLADLARASGIRLIEDAAHALGAEYQGRRVGSHADFVCFSFQAIKLLTTGDGGALVCRETDDDQRARRLRWFGLDRQFMANDECRWDQEVDEHGYKFHMNDIAATIGLEQLKHLDAHLGRHRAHAAVLDACLAEHRLVRPLRRMADRRSAHWIYTVRVTQRADFIGHMQAHGVACSRVHIRNDRYRLFADSRDDAGLPGVAEFEREQVSLPCGWWLSEADLATICAALATFGAEQ